MSDLPYTLLEALAESVDYPIAVTLTAANDDAPGLIFANVEFRELAVNHGTLDSSAFQQFLSDISCSKCVQQYVGAGSLKEFNTFFATTPNGPYEYALNVQAYASQGGIYRLFSVRPMIAKRLEATMASPLAKNTRAEQAGLLSDLTHELRTPLNAILGFSEMMKIEAFGPISNPRYKGYLDDIMESGQNLLGTINDVLEYARAEYGQLTYQEQALDFAHVVNHAAQGLNARLKQHGIKLIFPRATGSVPIKGDAFIMESALGYALTHLAKITPPHGEIELQLASTESHATLTLRAYPQHEGNIIQLAEMADAHSGKPAHNISLALSLTNKYVKLHNGQFKVLTHSPRLVEFSITIPLAERAQADKPVLHAVVRNKSTRAYN